MSIYEIITNKILDALDNNHVPWISPYSGTVKHQNFITKIDYKGINTVLLNTSSYTFGFECPYWLSFKQLTTKGWHLRKGSKVSIVTFYKKIVIADPENEEDENNASEHEHIVLRYYNVFNIQQLEEFDTIKAALPAIETQQPQSNSILFDYIRNNGVGLLNQQTAEYSSYCPELDRITMANCNSMEKYSHTLSHEIIHSTGHQSRLHRTFGNRMSEQGRNVYSMEELVAEIGSIILCNTINIPFNLDNSAAYCSGWARFLRQEKKTAIVKATSMAQKAIDYVLNMAGVTESNNENQI